MRENTSTPKIILLVGRDNWQKDDALNHTLLRYLKTTNFIIKWEDPAGDIIYKFRQLERKIKLPDTLRKMNLRIVQLLYGITHWSYFVYLSDRKNQSVEFRSRKLKESILKLGAGNELIILSRSAGGRISSLVADELKIKQLICLSYPFKHPEKEKEPGRYQHLKNLKTPFLIIQGNRDEYGGLEVAEKYELSPAIELFFVDTTHNFNISSEEWKTVLEKIGEVIEPVS